MPRWGARGLALALLWAAQAGCDDTGPAGAALDRGPLDAALAEAGPADAGADRGAPVDRGVPPDAQLPDAQPRDAGPDGLGPPPPPEQPACQATAPALFDDRTVYVDGQRLAIAGPGAAAPNALGLADAAALPPLAVAGQPFGAATVFVATRPAAGGCEVLGVDAQANLVWRAPVAGANGCTRPALAREALLVPVATAQGGAAVLLDPATGAERARVALPGAPTTDAVRLAAERDQNGGSHWQPAPPGAAENGGSHWVVGVGDRLVDLAVGDEPQPTLAVQGEVGLGAFAMSLAAVGPGRLAVTARRRAQDPGYGDLILRWALGADERLIEAGPPIEAGAPLTTPLVGAADCEDLVANGGSHWWCPGGLLVGAGEDWLAGWRWTDGALVGRAVKALHSTGVVVSDDGRIFNGGSHWRGVAAQWAVVAVDLRQPDGEPAVVAEGRGAQPACVAPVTLDPGGRLDLLVTGAGAPPALQRLRALAGGLAPGWSRPVGGNAGQGRAVGALEGCGAGTARYRRPVRALSGLDSRAGAQGPEGVFLSVPDGQGGPPGVAALDPLGRLRWIRTVAPPRGEASLGWAAMAPVGAGVAAVAEVTVDGRRAIRLLVLDRAGEVVVDRLFDDGQARLPTALAAFEDGGLVVAGLAAQPGVEPEFILARLAPGLEGEVAVQPLPAQTYPEALTAVGQDVALVGSFGPGPGLQRDGVVMRLDPDGQVRWRDDLVDPDAQVVVQALGADSAGELLVAGVRLQGATEPFLRRYAAAGASLVGGVPPEPRGRYVGVTLSDRGLGVVLDEFGQIVSVSPGGAVGEGAQVADGEVIVHTLSRPPSGDRLILGVTFEGAGVVPTPLVVRQGGFGAAGCVEAGRCAALADDACLGPNPCEVGLCETDSGLCSGIRVEDGTPCGEGVCQGGLCMLP